jgi:predicted enzyme related to lactoylglutathione lyase
MAKPIVHFEIIGPDMEALKTFYGDLFSWEFHDVPEMGYSLVHAKSGDKGIDGGVGNMGEPRTTIYAEVPDPQATVDAAVAKGAEIVMPVTEIPGAVTMAMFKDPAGNIVGIVKEEPAQS